mgnify:CR=1 FL=1
MMTKKGHPAQGDPVGNIGAYNVPHRRGPVDPSARSIAKAGTHDYDLALDDGGRWWAVAPISATNHRVRHRLCHSAVFWLIDSLSSATADRWQAGTCSATELGLIEDWLLDVLERGPAARPAGGRRHE